MKVPLLDVNLLIALAWPNHSFHAEAIRWFREHRGTGFATCPITEAGFVRISMNPRAVSESKSSTTVLDILRRFRSLPGHRFWTDDLDLDATLSRFALLTGHRQVTDAYLLALAVSKGGCLATFDRSIAAIAPEDLEGSILLID